ncbi:serine/threonine-protein phosphatase 2A regulatory subunit B'' subunit beta isoform X1 [Lagopus leucura]|uniref:serine/threonine-protein phosphatase 2A regulatory subunit B'' subunit beta isoform X1 n=1 Tax=Lagopus leucura TaxID=30410 RepID=UPI001C6730A5|nr:serine/threonine-protein phosphatase 2A regulatory subunit B'' subunit beta isoform X1 [Lagopus leucura]XP_042724179.1 serine/threonine-protein phosphatase 2A regulatory subunit B'' subunit beta isoform X1 [Lagopus leucura]XP_042724180.1 serine/threonine-protein phosphatase 2A regulatory subunit B'' subunit beta isoform X1 [Lagopus leucura]XP_042724181.1 serine/threonine-protein phosphatase 2A regulatory subunit B'' subunit beta isoform X1 [Lagopus leucura]
MPPGKVLQPVLKMKVDELFLCWLSQPTTQLMLKDCLKRIKNEGKTEIGSGDAGNSENERFTTKNSNSKQSILGDIRLPLMPFTPPQLSTSLPLATSTSLRNASNVKGTRRSSGTRVVQTKKEETLPPSLSQTIPTFYFPRGCPKEKVNIDAVIAKIEKTFSQFPNERATLDDMGKVAKACDCPLYWKGPLFYCAGGERTGYVSVHKFVAMWRKILQTCYDDAAKFVHLLMNPGCNYLVQEDFIPFLQDVVNSHPGLSFLKEASEFHSRYITTVIQRIFYTVNRSWSGKITCNELRKSNFLQNVALLEEEADINQLTEYFSYEHFYVIYCKFWELDTDHDLYIDRKDLARHNDHAISNRMIERIFSGAVTRGRKAQKDGKISYADFVWFLISEEDKKTPTSIEYWFRCMDLDGDGALSMYELEYFYEEQCQKLDNMAIEPLPFEDCLCQMLDLVKPQCEGKITLHDLKRCKLTNVFFDTFFNIEKYLDHEQKDQFSILRESEGESPEVSDWEKYAAEEYDILVAEEAASDQWNDGYEAELNPADHQKANVLKYQMEKRPFFEMPSHLADVDLDEYDYEEDFE